MCANGHLIQAEREPCLAHRVLNHDFFLNYRVEEVAKRGTVSFNLCLINRYWIIQKPVVQQVYECLATKKKNNGQSIFVFWDKKCISNGQDWEHGYLHGMQNSQAIVLLISDKVYLNYGFCFSKSVLGSGECSYGRIAPRQRALGVSKKEHQKKKRNCYLTKFKIRVCSYTKQIWQTCHSRFRGTWKSIEPIRFWAFQHWARTYLS